MVYGCFLDGCLNKVKVERFNAIIIGSGQAGNPLSKRLANEGMRVAVVEMAYIGGTCINYGCTPTKTLVGVARNIVQACRASDYGIVINSDVPDYKLINRRKDEVVEYYREKLERSLVDDPNITVYRGKARFSGYKEVSVQLDDVSFRSISADMIFINTGARPRIPGIEGLQSVKYYTSQTILDLQYLPKHLLIVGGGYIALEFSQIFRRLGTHVTIIEKSSGLLPHEDDDVGLVISQVLEVEGVRIITGATIRHVSAKANESIDIEILYAGKTHTLSGSHLLVAAGRLPNTADLDLSATNIRVDAKGFIPVNDQLETTEPGIYALGDVKDGPAFTHVSYHDYLLLAGKLLDNRSFSIRNRLIPYCVFTDPEFGRIGLTEKEASEKGLDFSVAKMKTSLIARAIETGETSGFIKAIVDNKTKKILGVAVICAGGGELMSLFQIAMLGGLTYEQLRDTMFAHPTYAEAINNLFNPVHLKSKG